MAAAAGGPARSVRGRRGARRRGRPYVVASPQLATSAMHRGHRTAIPPREALILQAVLNHPWLLHDHLEELAELEFRHAEAERLKGVLIDIYAHDGDRRPAPAGAKRSPGAVADLLDRVGQAITTNSVWGLAPEAAPDGRFIDVETACCLASAVAFPN